MSTEQHGTERHIVIMAGGRGERFWPQSRVERPKHLLPVVGDKPLIAQTVERVAGLVPAENIWIIGGQDDRCDIIAACPQVLPAQVIGEPRGRDTAAVVAVAAALVRNKLLRQNKPPAATLAMLPADAVIDTGALDNYRQSFNTAFALAEDTAAGNPFVTLGVQPTSPATGYGYIELGEQLAAGSAGSSSPATYRVRRFVEKPDRPTAERYLAAGNFLWNAGIFFWTLDALAGAFLKHEPELWKTVSYYIDRDPTNLVAFYLFIKKISIDYALLEKHDNTVCIRTQFGWDDVGEWTALARLDAPDAAGNIQRGATSLLDAAGNIVVTDSEHLVAAFGVNDLVIVHTPTATLVCPKSRAQELKQLVSQLPSHWQ
jgi:mannose-1-phosphate guanylyltransferase